MAGFVLAICCGVDRHIGVTLDRHISARSGWDIVIVDSGYLTAIRGYIDCELTAAAVCGDGNAASVRVCTDTLISADGNFVVANQLDGQVIRRSSAERDPPAVVVVQRQRAGGGIIRGVVVC